MTAAAMAATGRVGISRRRQQAYGLFYLLLAIVMAVFFGQVEPGAQSTFGMNVGGTTVPDLVVPSAGTAYLLAAMAAMAGVIQLIRGFGRRWGIVMALVVIAFAFAFLTWAGAGGKMSLAGILQTTLQRSVPITFGAMSGIICERAGVVNIAIEGMLLAGAFTSAVVGSAAANPWIGIAAAIVTGGLLAALLAVLAIRYLVDQIIVGVVEWFYFAGLESSALQATVGKMALGIRVTDLEGQRIGFLRATGRLLAKIISALILYIGFIMAGFTARKQALHDMMCGTLVVR